MSDTDVGAFLTQVLGMDITNPTVQVLMLFAVLPVAALGTILCAVIMVAILERMDKNE